MCFSSDNIFEIRTAIIFSCVYIYLRGKVFNCPILFEFGLYAKDRPQWGMKKPKRLNALRPSGQSYRHFTGISACGMVYINKSNDSIPTWDFAHMQVYLWVECPENFSSKGRFLPEIFKSQKSLIYHGRC